VGRILFVTGTDTGVGKTLLTALLLASLRRRGIHALAMKPFCSGDRADVELLQSLQRGELSDEEVNPAWLKAPLAPQIAARLEGRRVDLKGILKQVRAVAKRCDVLLVEGVGGALVPLSASATVADFAAALKCQVLVVGCNRLGAINHVRLTLEALRRRKIFCRKLILMDVEQKDLASATNGPHLRATLENIEVFSLPFLGQKASECGRVTHFAKKYQKVLARIWGPANFTARSLERPRESGSTKKQLSRIKKDR